MPSAFSHQDLRVFLSDAKRRTYASQGDAASVTPLLPGTRQLEYASGPWLYRDIYAGMAFFVGQELVYHQHRPVWSMVYAGGIVDMPDSGAAPHTVYPFLQAALRLVPSDQPYRGPADYAEQGCRYANRATGSLLDFHGDETIAIAETVVYRLRYSGGLLR
jgi:hypothetical protein